MIDQHHYSGYMINLTNMYFATPMTMLIFGASTFTTSIPELDTREPLDPGLPKCGVEIFIGGFAGQ